MKIARIIFLILLSVIPIVVSSAASQIPAGRLRLTTDDFPHGKFNASLEKAWLYQAGDDPEWASPTFNDSSWRLQPTAYHQEDVNRGFQAPLCWYRLRLEVDSSLAEASLYMTLEQQGAVEVFLNGRLIYTKGRVGKDSAREEVRIYQSFEPVRLPVVPGANLLAIRYSNHSTHTVLHQGIQPGFRVFLLAGKSLETTFKHDRDLRVIGWSLIVGLGLALTLLHLVMFSSYPAGRENLYFAAFAASIMIFSFLIVKAWFVEGWNIAEANSFFVMFRILLVVMALTGMRFMQSVRGLKTRLGGRLFMTLLVIGCTIAWLTNVQVAYVIVLLACLETVRSLWIAVRQRIEKIWIVGLGFAALVPMVIHQLIIELGWVEEQSWHEYPPLLMLLAMLLSMSAYLGSRFASINQRLEIKIAEVRKSQEALAESEARYRSMFDNSIAGVGILDDHGQAIFVNDRWVEILGLKTEDVLGQDPRKYVAPQFLDEINLRLARLYRGETSRDTYEFEILRPDGGTRIVQVWATPYHPETGKIHLALLSMDMTETREAERLQREAIQLAEKTARMASIGVMAGGITHEINQPLNAIMLHAETLQYMAKSNKLDQSEHVHSALDHIVQSTLRISDIIQHMRSFWVTPIKDEAAVVDLNDPLRHGLLLMEQRVRSHGIRLKIEVDPGPLLVCADPLQVEQIVVNLISNAVNSLDKSGRADKEIFVRTGLEGETVLLEVKDNGVGLPPQDLNKIFDPFYSTDKEQSGTGLGLAIVRMFVEKFNGTVVARNHPEAGAIFSVRIPKCVDPPPAPPFQGGESGSDEFSPSKRAD